MNLIKFATVLVSSALLMACANLEQWEEEMDLGATSTNRYSSAPAYKKTTAKANPQAAYTPNTTKMVSKTVVTKRINTTACGDSDDWYLDGYRVGKSFRTQKNQMLQQRSSYCGYSVNKIPSQYRNNWERGFRIGTKG